jgi:type IV secretion system protein TrbL
MDPSRLAGYGLDATEPLTQKIADLGLPDASELFVFGFGYLAILACFFIMAINVFLAVLEYYLFAALVGIFLPFGLLSPTKFLAEKAVGAVVSASVKLMVLAFVTAVIDPVLRNVRFTGPNINFNDLWSVLLTVCALMFFCWKAPHLAASLLGGSPHLGTGDVLQAAGAPIAAAMALDAVGSRVKAQLAATRAAATAGQGATRAASSPSSGAANTSAAPGAPNSSAASGSATSTAADGAGGKGTGAHASESTAPGASVGATSSLVRSAMGKPPPPSGGVSPASPSPSASPSPPAPQPPTAA